jgi:uncharacterized membrane protein (DUF4010 family)
MDLVEIYLFFISMLIGALIGTERQRRLVEDNIRGVAGLRTFILISLLGTLSATLTEIYGPLFMVVAFGSFVFLVGLGYAVSERKLGRLDFTSEVAAVVTFILGALCYSEDKVMIAVALAILTTSILATRRITHHYVETISETELLDTLKVGIIALVILPLLPDYTLDPLDVLNPRKIWMMVVLVSLIGYIGYIMIRIFGTDKGLSITGIMGGLVSSTAVTTSMATEVRAHSEIIDSAVFATTISSCTMFPRVLLIILIVNRELFLPLLIPLISMTITGVTLAYLLFRKREMIEKEVELKDPFRLVPALTFGAFFALILLISKLASTYFGDEGIYAASLIAGLADVDAITLSMATLAGSSIATEVAVASITLATIMNTIVKLSIAYILGTKDFGMRITTTFAPMIIVGILAVIIT